MREKKAKLSTLPVPGFPIESREDLARFLFSTYFNIWEDPEDLARLLFSIKKKEYLDHLNLILYGKKRSSYYQMFKINKATGKPRTIHAVTGKLKDLQRTALDKFQSIPYYKPSFYAHGFTPDKSIITNASYHLNSKLIIKVDIKDFFPSISFPRVRGMFMSPPFRFGKEAATSMAHMACLDDESSALPQGGVLSPYISNMICRRMDKRLASLARDYHCRYTRYADDMTFSTNDKRNLNTKEFLAMAYEIIESENFLVNREKEKILTRKDRQIVTGIVVNDGMNVNRKYIRNIRATIYNCEKNGVASQLVKNGGYRDNRNSRLSFEESDPPSEKSFLKHLLGKINFFGNVAMYPSQKEQYDKDNSKYQRIKTYEELLWRFYNLNEVKKSQDKEIKNQILKIMNMRLRLKSRLSVRWNRDNIRDLCLKEYRIKNKDFIEVYKSKINYSSSMEVFCSIILDLKKTDPRYFQICFGHDLEKSKKRAINILSYPKIDKKATSLALNSLKNQGDHDLKKIVHSVNDFTVDDCYEVLNENVEKLYYYLPYKLRSEFDSWREVLDKVFDKHGGDYKIDVVNDEPISKVTKSLKKNTRFGINQIGATGIYSELDKINYFLRKDNKKIRINLENLKKNASTLYTHVPSIIDSIKLIFDSTIKHSKSVNKELQVELENLENSIEIIISDNSTEPSMDRLSNRDFVHGTLGEVVKLTNGLCDYFIEITQTCGERACLNMHTEQIENSRFETGFVHRLIFSPKVT